MELHAPRSGEHLFALGNTGSGKSQLMKALFESDEVLDGIVVNTKWDPDFDRMGEPVKGEKIYRVGPGKFVWYPPDDFIEDMDARERFFKWALDVGHRHILIDEINDVAEGPNTFPRHLKRCYMRGRSSGLSMWSGTQAPVGVPSFTLGQCRHKYVFALGHPNQRKAAEHFFEAPIPWDAMPEGNRVEDGAFKFVYRGPGNERLGPVALELP